MPDHIRITRSDGHWVVRAGGAVIGETDNALILSEGALEDVVYVPREDIEMAFLDPSPKTTHCPHKGDASYFTIVAKSGPIENAAWSYEDPKEEVARIKNHLAFYVSDRVAVEQV